MSQTRPIQFPVEQADRLEAEAKAMGMTVPAYFEFLKNCDRRKHDAAFRDASKYVLKNFTETLKKLAQ